ncbi:MAG: hypothetical protein ABC585_06725 [Candidatus Methanosuratincola petrocarbonis]|nr:hypothetical protein [Candidatus Methanosuratincola sp.]
MTNKKLVLIPAALIVALFAFSVTYGLWFQALYVEGTVNTGVLEWKIVDQFTSDAGEQPDRSILPGFEGDSFIVPEGKHVGWTDCVIADDGMSATFTMYNTYPCYLAMFSVYFRNTGTVPIHVEYIEFYDGGGNLIVNYTYPFSELEDFELDLTGDGLPDIEILWLEPLGDQIHPGDRSSEYSWWVHVLQTAPEGATLTYMIKPFAVQWNESDWPIQYGQST